MDEINNYVNSSDLSAPEEKPSRRAAIIPLIALGLSALFWHVFNLQNLWAWFGPGIGVLVVVIAHFAAVLGVLGRRARWNAGGVFLTAASLLLAISCGLYSVMSLTILNCFVILLTAAMATFALSGQGGSLRRWAALPETVELSVLALLTRMNQPFCVLKGLAGHNRARLGRAALSVGAALCVGGVVLWLLSSADAVFGSMFTSLGDWLRGLEAGEVLWKLIRTLVLALLIASGLYFIREAWPVPEKEPLKRERHAAPFLAVTLLLDGIYVLFCAVQFAYLFGGREAAVMAGGWSAYAREGFFQLVAVAAINLAVCLLGTDKRRFGTPGGRTLRIASALMLALTAVILASALRRMQLYILAYGLSVLRLLTLWAMAVIAVGLLAAGWRLYRPGFAFFPVFGGIVLGTWCLLCLCNPGGLIARYNAEQYLAGTHEAADVWYLCDLGPDALPALRRIEEETEDNAVRADAYGAIRQIEDNVQDCTGWSRWKLSFLRAE